MAKLISDRAPGAGNYTSKVQNVPSMRASYVSGKQQAVTKKPNETNISKGLTQPSNAAKSFTKRDREVGKTRGVSVSGYTNPAKVFPRRDALPPGVDLSKIPQINIGAPKKKVVTPVAKAPAKKKGLTGVDLKNMTSKQAATMKPGTYSNVKATFPSGRVYGSVTVGKGAGGVGKSVTNSGASKNAGGATKGGFGRV